MNLPINPVDYQNENKVCLSRFSCWQSWPSLAVAWGRVIHWPFFSWRDTLTQLTRPPHSGGHTRMVAASPVVHHCKSGVWMLPKWGLQHVRVSGGHLRGSRTVSTVTAAATHSSGEIHPRVDTRETSPDSGHPSTDTDTSALILAETQQEGWQCKWNPWIATYIFLYILFWIDK